MMPLLIILAVGTVLMAGPMLLVARKNRLPLWKVAPISVLLTAVGTIGTYIWFWIESGGDWGGRSFYGAVFIVPLVFVAIAPLFRVSYGTLMDLCAPAECLMLAIMKIQCLLGGCCSGRLLYITEQSTGVYFPSALAEMINALLLCAVLVFLSVRKGHKKTLYPYYLILYGVSRFILNMLRAEWESFEGFLPYGNIWSLVAIAIGFVWLFILNHQKTFREEI